MISVIILNWNNAPDTLECLASVYRSDDANFSVLVVDNGSEDDSLSLIQQAYPQVRTLSNTENLGFAEGNNRAIRASLEEGAEYIFLLNNDAIIAKDTLSQLRRAAEMHPNAAALGSTIYFYDEPASIWNCGTEWNPEKAICILLTKNAGFYQKATATQFVCGCAFFARASHLRKIGLMEPRFFLNWEEIDWCSRIHKLGFDCLYVSSAKVWHKISRSFIGGRGPMWHYFNYRNRLFWMERNLPLSERIRIAKKRIWPELKYLIGNFFNVEEGARCRAALAGFRDYCFRRFGKGPERLFRK